MTQPASRIRPATPADVVDLLRLITDLAAFERAEGQVEASAEQLTAALFPPDGQARSHALVAELVGPEGSQIVGFAVWYTTFSTWLGRHGIWLEDLYVSPAQRGTGLGRRLLRELASVCQIRDYGRLEWWVLNWNTSAIDFYESLGAVPQAEWTVYRLDGRQLQALAELQ
jgi:GNAT superfamily N-acetyltransferase